MGSKKTYLNCRTCGKRIYLNPKLKLDINWWGDIQPETDYWNVERREVYCNAYCSLKRHEEIRHGKRIHYSTGTYC